nr:MAG TPA: hypothetical protein [Caudoviricetes sp.]
MFISPLLKLRCLSNMFLCQSRYNLQKLPRIRLHLWQAVGCRHQ